MLLAGLWLCGTHCGGVQTQSPMDALQQTIASAKQRLTGTWILRRFVPEVPLEGSLQMLLQVQFGRLSLTLDGDTIHARGPGVETDRRLLVRSAYGEHFDGVVYDQFGVGYEVSADFQQADKLIVQIVTLPWRGQAELTRSGAR